MTGIAVVVAGYVARVLAHRLHAVVTTEAGASHLQMIDVDDRQKVVTAVTCLAVVLRQYVTHRARSCIDTGAHLMATHALAGSALEDALHVAVLAGQVAVEAAQLVPRGQMVKTGSAGRRRRAA